TYRTLVAADSAIMLLDNRKGVEEQTRKLFEVCKLRRIPIFTFVNKSDRAGENPLQLIDDVESELGITCFPVTWPIHHGNDFLGVYDRMDERVRLFEAGGDHGSKKARVVEGGLDDPVVAERVPAEVRARVKEELELLELAGAELDADAVRSGDLSLTFFGSALTNFGVEPLLRYFLAYSPPPPPRETEDGDPVAPDDPAFTGFVFKIQANMDPRHRDRIAFLRVCSGCFEPGMQVDNTRSGDSLRLAQPQQFMARDRRAIEEAWPGDVIGLHDRGQLRIGDTLSANGDVHFGGIPRFSPEHFARIRTEDPLRRKQLDTGLRQLSEEGAAQVFYEDIQAGHTPIVGAVGLLQFDVLLHRLEGEYGARARLERLQYSHARWVEGPEPDIRRVARGEGRLLVFDSKERPLILFSSRWALQHAQEREDELRFHAIAP
ncbi:MAG: peptide chain release factor 3, partial [Gemmatimonadota bacterium]